MLTLRQWKWGVESTPSVRFEDAAYRFNGTAALPNIAERLAILLERIQQIAA
jgi:hypothetical protein